MRSRFFCARFYPLLLREPTIRMRYWLMKSEPDEVSYRRRAGRAGATSPGSACAITRPAISCATQMQVGDGVLFYHSSCAVPGIAGIAEVASGAYPDAIQFDAGSKYFDPKATPKQPRWISVDVQA